jgi:fumarate reductase (CoM/CoB) subunit A
MVKANKDISEVRCEVLVIGSEAAGARAAIEAREAGADVILVSKGLVGRSGNTIMAGCLVQAPLGHMDPHDNPDVFFEDVVKGGAFLNNQKLVERLCALSMTEVPRMEEWGARFLKKDEKYVQIRVPGSSYPRSLHTIGHRGGPHWRKALANRLQKLRVSRMEDVFITSLLLSEGRVEGAIGISLREGRVILFRSKVTILATGGCAQIFRKTDASRDATGDGMMLAYRSGAELMDMEFHQFSPLCAYVPSLEMALEPGVLRYELHAKVYNARGEEFLERYLPLYKDWDLRDATSRAIYLEGRHGRGGPNGGAYVAVNHLPENIIDEWIRQYSPAFLARWKKLGIDVRRHAIEAGPGSHYTMGGIKVNENCETSLPGLYAAGEVASGMDGAERIDGGPAITWCLTMGCIAGGEASRAAKDRGWPAIDTALVKREKRRIERLFERRKGLRGFEVKNRIKEIMWEYCALVRDKEGMQEGLKQISATKEHDVPDLCVPDPSPIQNKGLVEALEAANMADLAEITMRAALMRRESRKSHYRMDFPGRDDKNWLKNIVVRIDGNGQMSLETRRPSATKMLPYEGGEDE